MQDRRKQRPGGFTLIELLTVVAIISLLIAILSVGTRKVKILSKGLQQKSVFHAMTVGLELFSGDFDGYPDSQAVNTSGGWVSGAQHLAEARRGRDNRGDDLRSRWRPSDDQTADNDLYSDVPSSLARRKGPYCELKYGTTNTIYDLWGSQAGIYDSGASPAGYQRSPIITDVFTQNDTPVGRVGMPIMYFKADSTKRFRVDAARQTVAETGYVPGEYSNWVYDLTDNVPILQLPWLRDPAAGPPEWNGHYPDPDNSGKSQAWMFYEQITQQANPAQHFFRPFNGATFILISAGWDGIFGTKDDIVNFD